ncbi:MAG TPA: hypothetical protein V6D29_09050 [Leptolyngbyaceae cyanobacterium]
MFEDENEDFDAEALLEEVADNPGARAAAINAHPEIAQIEAQNAAAGEGPNASGSVAASTAEEHVPSTSDPYATDLPTANTPDPKAANPETNPNAAAPNDQQD